MPKVELYSEQDVLHKVIVPDLQRLGYRESVGRNSVEYRFNYPITAHQGREVRTIFADLVVYVNDEPVVVVDAKNPRSYLTENDREQVVSYARLLPSLAPFAALCNGGWQYFESIRKRQLKALPTKSEFLDSQSRSLSRGQQESLVQQATRTLFAIESVRDLSRLMRRCHDIIRNLKGYDPTKAFDELSKVLFAKMFEEREVADKRRKFSRFTTDFVKELRSQGVEIIQTIWRDAISSDRLREVFGDESALSSIELPVEALDKIVGLLENKSLGLTDLDVKGVAFEEFLSSTYRGGGLGQYFTPREVVNFMVDLVDPAIGDRIIDPSCGTGGFLIRSYDVVSEKIRTSGHSQREKARLLTHLANASLVGIDWEPRAARTCKMNMIIHGDGHAGVYHANALDVEEVDAKVSERRRFFPNAPGTEPESFDVIITNPPFGARDDVARILDNYKTGKGGSQKREVLLLERQINLLRPGGRLGVVVPEGILSNKNDSLIRTLIFENCIVRAVIRLPQDAFRMSQGAACTSVLFATKKASPEEEQVPVFFARASYTGSSAAGKQIPQNDLPAILDDYRRFERGAWEGLRLEMGEQAIPFVSGEANSRLVWMEPNVNRTTLLYDRLSFVVSPKVLRESRFSYTYFHPWYFHVLRELAGLGVELRTLEELCVEGFPARGKKPIEASIEGIPVLKVRNVTSQGLDMDTEFAPDTDEARSSRGAILKGDVLITSTGEGTIGRVEVYPFDEPAIADGHITICRLKQKIDSVYVAEFLRSEHGQIQMLRYVSGSTGQTELLIDHVRELKIPLPKISKQRQVVKKMKQARDRAESLRLRSRELRIEAQSAISASSREMLDVLKEK